MDRFLLIAVLAVAVPVVSAREYHVSTTGDDAHDGSAARPLRTISAAAALAGPGDVITVHQGVYRERVSPPRGGTGGDPGQRITYQAAPGEKVVIKGSEIIKGWQKVQNDTWNVSIPNQFFGQFNPYTDVIKGDWFSPQGREHHTGAVYLDDHWLTEAATLEQVLAPVREKPLWDASGPHLLNVAWLRPAGGAPTAPRVPAAGFAGQSGVQTAPASEGGDCIGWIEHGDWVRYDRIDFGSRTEKIEIRAASETAGGMIEIRRDSPEGELLGRCRVANTGGWQSWVSYQATIKPLSGVQTLCLVFKSLPASQSDRQTWRKQDAQLWFARADASHTTLWAQFPGVDPNEAGVEINVRQTAFYPEKPGINFITVRGFALMHAATPWAPPTAGQIGLIGTHWSRGWIIEDNNIRYSTCVGVALGKYGDEFDNTSQNTAEGYVKTIERALKNGWSEDNIGRHVVRNNRIAHCEQAGIVGSLGAAFCTVTGNVIHDIHVRRLFSGAEMAGIKFHAAIDTQIIRNHIHRTCRGIWLDWMAQGTRVTGNLLHDNGPSEDLFLEVNHGPFLVDNNFFLSPIALFDMSEGGAFAHNLFAGRVVVHPELGRETPFHQPHSTRLAGLCNIRGGDHRFYNNLFTAPAGLSAYDQAAQPMHLAGNVFLKGASASRHEPSPLVLPEFDPQLQLVPEQDAAQLRITLDPQWAGRPPRPLVTTGLLGTAKIPALPFEQPDGSPYRLDTDYLGRPRPAANPFPGPVEPAADGRQPLKLWPVSTRD